MNKYYQREITAFASKQLTETYKNHFAQPIGNGLWRLWTRQGKAIRIATNEQHERIKLMIYGEAKK